MRPAGPGPAGCAGRRRCRRRGPPSGRSSCPPPWPPAARGRPGGSSWTRPRPVQLGDADAAGDAQEDAGGQQFEAMALAPLRGVHRPQLGDDPLGERRGLLEAVGDDDGELVAAQAADEVAVPDRRPQPRGHLDEQVVARLVTGDVVHRLEAVEVEQQEARRGASPGDAGPRRGQCRHQPSAVGQAGQVVGVGQALELQFPAPSPGHVAQVQHQPVPAAGPPTARTAGPPGPPTDRPCGPSRTAATTRRARAAGTRARGCRPHRPPGGGRGTARSGRPAWTKSRSSAPSRSRGDQAEGVCRRGCPGHLPALVEHDRDVGGAVHEGAEERLGAQHLAGQPGTVARPDQRPRERQAASAPRR